MDAKQVPIKAFIHSSIKYRRNGWVLHTKQADALRNASDMATIFRGGRLRHGNALHVGGVRIKFNWTGGRPFGTDCRGLIIDNPIRKVLARVAVHARQIGTERRLANAIKQAAETYGGDHVQDLD